MSESTQEKVSRLVYDTAIFKWSIQNFFIDNIEENGAECFLSPPFKFASIDWYLEIIRTKETIQLHLSHKCTSTRKDLSGINYCELNFSNSDFVSGFYDKFKNPFKVSDICLAINIPTLDAKNYLLDNTFKVYCKLSTRQKLVHDNDIQQGIENNACEKEKSLQQRFSNLAKSIGSIMDDSRFSDITLKVGEDTFQAHKAILASRSRVFDGMFESGMKENQEGVVQMVDMKSSTVKEMLYYIYTGNIEELSMDRAMDLYAAADRYDLPELLGCCKDFIVKHISADDVCNVSVLADLHRDEELSETARSVFKQHSKTIVKSQGWRDLAENHISVYKGFVDSILIEI